jgi:short subunit dehydrogenase-like uncharacterized protein
MTGKIVLLGATGYTGARTAEAMTRRGLRPVLAGRDAARLAPLAERLGGLATAVADSGQPGSVRALVESGDVLVTTVGPFIEHGAAAVQAAIDAGAVYFDTTGEPPFIRRVFEEYGPKAAAGNAALLTAFGNDYVPGTLAGALALRDAADRGGGAAAVHVGYFIVGGGRGQGFSRGTLNSLLGVVLEPMYTWTDGELRAEQAGRRFRTFTVAGHERGGISIGGSEQFALPRFAQTGAAPALREVDVYLGWFGPASRAVHRAAPLTPLLGKVPALSKAVVGLGRAAAARMSDEPDAATLAATTSYFVGEAFDAAGGRLASVTLRAPEPYAITAELLAWAAGHAAEHGVRGTGALDPVSAFGLDTLRAGAAEAGIVPG